MSMDDLTALGIKGVTEARVHAPLTNNIRIDTRISLADGFCSLINLSHFRRR